jgi:hypothetical protein
VTDLRELDAEDVALFRAVAVASLAVEKASAPARAWWNAFEAEAARRQAPELVLRLAEEVLARDATLDDLVAAGQGGPLGSVPGTLAHLEYRRLKRDEERKKRGVEQS